MVSTVTQARLRAVYASPANTLSLIAIAGTVQLVLIAVQVIVNAVHAGLVLIVLPSLVRVRCVPPVVD